MRIETFQTRSGTGDDIRMARDSRDDVPRFTIGDLSREFGVTLRALRFYEDRNLIRAERRGLTRLYSERDRSRMSLILLCKRVGLTLTEIKGLLDLRDRTGPGADFDEALCTKFEAQVEMLEEQRAEIDSALGEGRSVVEETRRRIAAQG